MISLDIRLAKFTTYLVNKLRTITDRSNGHPLNDGLVYHYTHLDAFLKILENRKLWMSDLRFVNDATELQYGFKLLDECVKAQK